MAIENNYSRAIDIIPMGSYYDFVVLSSEFGIYARIIAAEGGRIQIEKEDGSESILTADISEGEIGILYTSLKGKSFPQEDHPFWDKVTRLKIKILKNY